ncbi:MAG TPA: plastocyanin/azurin family copper-binding protein [Gemmatimonadales bacterium]
MQKWFASIALLAMACGGGGESGDASSQAAAPAPAAAAPAAAPSMAATGTVHEVQMLLTDAGEYRYEPATLNIKQGDTVRWINVSGGPHNVAFYANKIPAGAAAVLNEAMANKMMPLTGELLVAENAVYEISFAGAPAGRYDYVCTPHEMLGMVASLTVTQ